MFAESEPLGGPSETQIVTEADVTHAEQMAKKNSSLNSVIIIPAYYFLQIFFITY